MSSEVALNDSSLEVLPPAQTPSVNAREMLVSHAEMMHTAHQLASALVGTEMVPTRFRNKPDDAAAAILYGAELGLNPIQSLQRIIPIYGMPTLEARTMVALLKSRGYKIKTIAQSDESVTVWGQDLSEDTYESTWTIGRAVKAGYVPTLDERTGKYKTNAKGNLLGNEKYLTDPQAMLKAKAQAEVCREMAPDILIGISYTSEELQSERLDDISPASKQRPRSVPLTVEEIFNETPTQHPAGEGLTPDKSGERTGGHDMPPPSPVAEIVEPASDLDEFPTASGHGGGNDASQGVKPSSDATQESDSHDQNTPEEPPTAAMNRRMHALFRDAGLTDRDDRLTVTGIILGYRLDTSTDLTKSEASRLIDKLEEWSAAGELGDMINEILNQAVLATENQKGETNE